MKPLREILGVFFCINNIMDDITKKLIEAVNKITDKKRKLPSQEEIQKLHNDADKTLKGMKDLSHLPKWVREREITESEAFGNGGRPLPPPTKTPKIIKEMSDAEGQMAKGELEVMAKKAQELAAMMQDDTQLEAWVQSKITKAKDYISSVHDYMNGNPDKVD